ncbi:MAG: hypothetical protein ACK57G_09430, partial [Planctomycetota bacterium]
GLMIDELKLLARAVIVLDATGKVVYEEIVPEVASEPNYEKAIAALQGLVAYRLSYTQLSAPKLHLRHERRQGRCQFPASPSWPVIRIASQNPHQSGVDE